MQLTPLTLKEINSYLKKYTKNVIDSLNKLITNKNSIGNKLLLCVDLLFTFLRADIDLLLDVVLI